MKKIVGFGNALVDVLAVLEDDALLQRMKLPKGSMQLIDGRKLDEIRVCFGQMETHLATGGSAGNTVLALANLGAHPSLLGKIGRDAYGDFFLENCREKGIEPLLVRGDEPTGIASTFVSPDGERTFGTYLGAAATLQPEELPADVFEGCGYLYIEGYQVQNHALLQYVAQCAQEAGAKVCLDLASYNIVASDLDFFRRFVADHVDIVFANEDEARAFAHANPDEATRQIATLCEIAVVKLGANGVLVRRAKECVREAALHIEHVADTTGAGDFFAGGFLYALARGCTLRQCARTGTLLGGHVIQHIGTTLPEAEWIEIRTETERICSASS